MGQSVLAGRRLKTRISCISERMTLVRPRHSSQCTSDLFQCINARVKPEDVSAKYDRLAARTLEILIFSEISRCCFYFWCWEASGCILLGTENPLFGDTEMFGIKYLVAGVKAVVKISPKALYALHSSIAVSSVPGLKRSQDMKEV